MVRSQALEPVYWLIVSQETGLQEALTIGLGDGKEALPVFSWADEAELFLGLSGLGGDGWRIAESTAGNLASVLAEDSYAGVGFVALDPFPEMANVALGAMIALVSLSRPSFLNHLLTRKRGVLVS